MATRETLTRQAREQCGIVEKAIRTMKVIIEQWNALEYSDGLTKEMLGQDNQDLEVADLGNFAAMVEDFAALYAANGGRVPKALYKMLRQVDP